MVRLDRIPERLSEAVLVSFAGPLVNVTIAIELIAAKTTELSSQNNLFVSDSTNGLIIDHLVTMNLFLAACMSGHRHRFVFLGDGRSG